MKADYETAVDEFMRVHRFLFREYYVWETDTRGVETLTESGQAFRNELLEKLREPYRLGYAAGYQAGRRADSKAADSV